MDKNMISKSSVENFGKPDKETLGMISEYAVNLPPAEKIFTFNVILCDNEIDRDNERFDTDALKTLSCLFKGVTGIFDHNMKSENQTARIYKTEVITDDMTLTSFGEPYTYLKAA